MFSSAFLLGGLASVADPWSEVAVYSSAKPKTCSLPSVGQWPLDTEFSVPDASPAVSHLTTAQ